LTSWSDGQGWLPSGRCIEWVDANGSEQLYPAPDSTWVTKKIQRVLPGSGEVRVRLHNAALAQAQNVWFDNVTVGSTPDGVTAPAGSKPNYWPDPGFESVLRPNATVDLVGSPSLSQEGTNREGLKLLQVPTGASYTRKVGGLQYGKNYRFSVWKKVGSAAWARETRITNTADLGTVDILGNLSITLPLTADAAQTVLYDQAEVLEYNTGEVLPESWIPENRLGRIDWFITDHLGSTKLLIDQNGQHRFTGDDDPYGINLRSFGDKDTHRYTGQILDEEQGLYYYGARYYMPEIGRFLSGDPKKEFPSSYLYAGNTPVMAIDPDGKEVRWATRDLASFGIGTHHYLLLIPDNPSDFKGTWLEKQLFDIGDGRNGVVIGGYDGPNNKIQFKMNATPDMNATTEFFKGTEGFWRDDDFQSTVVPAPKGVTDTQFVSNIVATASAYETLRGKGGGVGYDLIPALSTSKNGNCASGAAWVLQLNGVSPKTTDQVSDMKGLDVGTNHTIKVPGIESLFDVFKINSTPQENPK
jgi:RHS repeat-associated protein